MVAVIRSNSSLGRTLLYNEQKVIQKKAYFLAAVNYPIALDMLSFDLKLKRLSKLASLNSQVRKNCTHISLNFKSTEHYSAHKLEKIAIFYMEKLGFEKQPFLVYEHHDAGHPHIHIVSTRVRPDGMRISESFQQMRMARTSTEEAFHLFKAQEAAKKHELEFQATSALRIQYGKSELTGVLSRVVSLVTAQYCYGSLEELNAALELYRVRADRGSVNSFLYQKKGLIYHALNEGGKSIGIPVKASQLYGKPTLPFLEKKFVENEARLKQGNKRLKDAIDWSFLKQDRPSLSHLILDLEKKAIATVIQKNKDTGIESIYFIDHQHKSIFEGSRLGERYCVRSIRERCLMESHSFQEESISLKSAQRLMPQIPF